MNGKKLPLVFICQEAAQKAVREADKFYQIGKKKTGKPWEAAMYPLAQLVLKSDIHKSPLDIVELSEIERIVITHVFYPLDKFKNYSTHKAVFKKGPGATMYMNKVLSFYINRYPLLDVFCKQHSHPWSGRGQLSKGDLKHSIFNAFEWYRKKGLNTMFSFVMTPMLVQENWNFNCFALGRSGDQKKLSVKIISKNHSFALETRMQPYYKTRRGKIWCNLQKEKLRDNGCQVSRNVLRRGWRRYTISIKQEKYLVCLPPFFPKESIKLYKVENGSGVTYREVALPLNSLWRKTRESFKLYDLLKLMNEMKGR